ncbi:MAG: peptide chain release factor N(5)-glutamine methyltransferase [Clostridia bacterium]|nr:peptide chain release factor N(5)-glutamine methyltransferase [Clostridia bacterium]
MTLLQASKLGTETLSHAGIENAANESIWILESVTGKTRSDILRIPSEAIGEDLLETYKEKLAERISGRPVQYILGKWEFYGREYYVNEGVLIPRPETEMLVDFALEYLKGRKNPVIVDLCAGTGCIGLTVASLIPDSQVYLVEKYDEAFAVLERNAEGVTNAKAVKGDIFDEKLISSLPQCDLLLSNPPYIRHADIPSLQSEVLREPLTALDAGEDGLEFYRALGKIYGTICKGAAAFECGEDQGAALRELLPGSEIIKDCFGNDRMVVLKEL